MSTVLAVVHHEVFGGPHNQILRLNHALEERGWETIALLPDSPGNASGRLRDTGIRVIQTPLHRPRKSLHPRRHLDLLIGFAPEINNIRRIIREQKVDLVQVFGPIYPHGAVAAHLEGVPVVWQLLGTFAPLPIRITCMPAVLYLADVVMTTGEAIARAHPGAARLKSRLVPFYPPVDTQDFRPDPVRRAWARKELGVAPNALLAGTVGNFNQVKGHDLLVQAAAQVREKIPNSFFRILGAASATQARYYDKHVKSLAGQLDLLQERRLQFVEPGSRVAEFLPAFDLFVLTSRSEGVPTSVLEAMACGLPVVTTDVGAVREVVQEGKTGRVVAARNSRAVAQAIIELLNDSAARQSMGNAARSSAIQRFDTRVCVATHLAAYELACRRCRHHRPERAEDPYTGDKDTAKCRLETGSPSTAKHQDS